jgi:hypothetical protein
MGWVDAADYERATPDPLANAARGILAPMNADHVDAMILGFSLKLKTRNGVKGSRINFLREVATPHDTRAMLVEMVQQAKA